MTIEIPEYIFGEKVEGAIERALAKAKQKEQTPPTPPIETKDKDNFIYVPSVNLYFAKELSHLGKNWHEAHNLLQQEECKMPTIPEFIAFLKHLRTAPANQEYQRIYNNITEVRDPWRSEWLDADFKVINKILHINYNHVLKNGALTPQNSEKLEDCLMENKTPGISLDEWLSNPTLHGLPKKDISDGDLYYYTPRKDNNSVTRLDAGSGRVDLDCDRDATYLSASLGVRRAKILGH